MSRPSSRSTSSILPGCSRHFLTMFFSVDRQHAGFRRHDDAVVVGQQIARRPQAVAVERGADLAAVGEGDRRRAVPRLHQRGVVFVEGAPLLVHERIARPGLGDHHHHGVGERIAALRQEFERVVEAGGVRLAFIGDRPQLVDVLAEQRRGDGRLPRRHPVDVAAQRVDLAVVRDRSGRDAPAARPGRCWSRSADAPAPARSRNPGRAGRDNRCRAGRPGTCPCRSPCGTTPTPGNSRRCGARGGGRWRWRSPCAAT